VWYLVCSRDRVGGGVRRLLVEPCGGPDWRSSMIAGVSFTRFRLSAKFEEPRLGSFTSSRWKPPPRKWRACVRYGACRVGMSRSTAATTNRPLLWQWPWHQHYLRGISRTLVGPPPLPRPVNYTCLLVYLKRTGGVGGKMLFFRYRFWEAVSLAP